MDRGARGLFVVMPVYNEATAVGGVLDEWLPALRRAAGEDFVFLCLNDGSTDRSGDVLRDYGRKDSRLLVVDKPNSGHGQTCLHGYRLAVEQGALWVLQIDSDGQCSPEFFPEFWRQREKAGHVFGCRIARDDGPLRRAVSQFVSVVVFLATGVWVRDANVPYRLMRAADLKQVIASVPGDFHLANILVAVLIKKRFGISWLPIRFRERAGKASAPKPLAFFAQNGLKLFRQLRDASPRL